MKLDFLATDDDDGDESDDPDDGCSAWRVSASESRSLI